MPKMLTTEQVRSTLEAYPWSPIVGVVEPDNIEWAYGAEAARHAPLSRRQTRAFL